MRARSSLRFKLVALDAILSTLAWCSAALVVRTEPLGATKSFSLLFIALGVVTLTIVISLQGLYRARVSSVRVVELTGLARAALASGFVVLTMQGLLGVARSPVAVAFGTIASFTALVPGRGMFSRWLDDRRTQGAFARRVLLVGVAAEVQRLVDLLTNHPELGYRPCGWVGPRGSDRTEVRGCSWLGGLEIVIPIAARFEAQGVVVAANSLPSETLNGVVDKLLSQGIHVHVSSGLAGIDHRRVRSLPFAHEPLMYLEQPQVSMLQLVVKRPMDIVLSALLLIMTAPIIAAAALAIAIEDGFPVFFRQERVGRDGQIITVIKLRTMVRDASARLEELREQNQRNGPLFKLAKDPRILRVGNFLRTTGLDELPQLWNVLTGSMSLVGPRPALPEEVAQFDADLLARLRVKPGITGLWQVEARSNPSFYAYRHLDLFYVQNWSPLLDLTVLLATAEAAALAMLQSVSRRESPEILLLGEPG